jgi:3-oxoacyl-[acyl-carrier protein] reductase
LGRIIRLTSGGDIGFPKGGFLRAAKAAQTNCTMSAALELARHGITANMVYPPVTDTTGSPTQSAKPSWKAAPTSTWHLLTRLQT